MPTNYISLDSIPEAEFDRALELMLAEPDLYDPAELVAIYKTAGIKVVRDPATPRLARYAHDALKQRRPLSVIRVSDGEASILGWDRFAETPQLDRYVAYATATKQEDRFLFDDAALAELRDGMLGAIRTADIIGVPGFWQEDGPTRSYRRFPDKFGESFRRGPRGTYGDWKGRVLMRDLARQGFFRTDQIIASNHLYFAFLETLDHLVRFARSILLMTPHVGIHEAMAKRFPSKRVALVEVGTARNDALRDTARAPFFLDRYRAALPDDLTGALCLIGGGHWALQYCQWIRDRGGVAIDMGSGMDLLAGQVSRPTHRRMGEEKVRGYGVLSDETSGNAVSSSD